MSPNKCLRPQVAKEYPIQRTVLYSELKAFFNSEKSYKEAVHE